MEPKFLSFAEKVRLIESVREGSDDAKSNLIFELDRLEGLVKDYHMVIDLAESKRKSTLGKKPKNR